MDWIGDCETLWREAQKFFFVVELLACLERGWEVPQTSEERAGTGLGNRIAWQQLVWPVPRSQSRIFHLVVTWNVSISLERERRTRKGGKGPTTIFDDLERQKHFEARKFLLEMINWSLDMFKDICRALPSISGRGMYEDEWSESSSRKQNETRTAECLSISRNQHKSPSRLRLDFAF